MTVVLRPSSAFPPGTSVAAYPEANWLHHLRPPSGAPVGAAAETDSVAADGTLTYDDLAVSTRYYAYAEVGGEHRYVAFASETAPAADMATQAELDAVAAAAMQDGESRRRGAERQLPEPRVRRGHGDPG